MGNPSLWSLAYESLYSATPGFDLHPFVVDFYLLRSWFAMVKNAHTQHSHPGSYYLDLATIKCLLDESSDQDIHTVILTPKDTLIQQFPVLFLHQTSNSCHFHLALFDYKHQEVFILGRWSGPLMETNMYANWTDWNGPNYWKRVGDAFGWAPGENGPKIIEPNWCQVN